MDNEDDRDDAEVYDTDRVSQNPMQAAVDRVQARYRASHPPAPDGAAETEDR
jgi:hypothetical protein